MKRIVTVIGGLFAFITGMASITPQLSKDLGELMDGVYSYVPQWGFGLITIAIIIVLWIINSPKKETAQPSLSNNTQGDKTADFTGAKIDGSTIIIEVEDKKKDNILKPEGVNFYPRWRNRNISVKKGSLDQVVVCIENGIKTSFWNHYDEEVWYEVDSSRSEFYNPKTHDMKVNGYVIHGVKNDIVIKENGSIKKVVGSEEKIANMFTLKIEPAGFKQKVIIHVRLDSDYLYAESFFDDVQKALENKFGKQNVFLQS